MKNKLLTNIESQKVNDVIREHYIILTDREISEKLLKEHSIEISHDAVKKRRQNMDLSKETSITPKKTGIEVRQDDKIVINWSLGTIITFLGEFGQINASFDMHKAIQRSYVTMGENETAAMVAMKFDFPHAKAVHLYAKLHGFTKSSLPQTDIEFESGLTAEDAVRENIQQVKRDAYKKTELVKWKMVQEDANKWRDFHNNVLKPFENYIDEHVSTRQPVVFKINKTKPKEDYVLVDGITDIHYLKLCVDNRGNVVYNREIARKKMFDTQKSFIESFQIHGTPKEIHLMIGTDNIHIDNPIQTTTAGTNMANSTDGEWHVAIDDYIDMQLDYIDMYASLSKVKLIIAPGNHDKNTSYLLGAFIKRHYRNNKNISVISAVNTERTFVPVGDKYCCIYEHGDNASLAKMDKGMHSMIMSEAKDFGVSPITTQFYHFSGHLHTEDQKDLGGNVIRIKLSAFCNPDKWHAMNNYNSTLQTMATLISYTKGRFTTLYK